MPGTLIQVLNAASHPPVTFYSFFLNSLLETVRLNIGECIVAAYDKLTWQSATKILMFSTVEETIAFIQVHFSNWTIKENTIFLRLNKSLKSEEVPGLKLISQSLTYATELERIV
jgi:26S proteasome regulatory subunit N12